jgi:hypothetical protein
VAALCLGLAVSVAVRLPGLSLAIAAAAIAALAVAVASLRAPALAVALLACGLWWGSSRLEGIDHSVLASSVGAAALVRAETTGPARAGRFTLRLPVHVKAFEKIEVDEPAQLELPAAVRAPPQGAVLEFVPRYGSLAAGPTEVRSTRRPTCAAEASTSCSGPTPTGLSEGAVVSVERPTGFGLRSPVRSRPASTASGER